MRFKGIIVSIGVVCLFLTVTAAGAADYRDWLPLLPDSIAGMKKSGEPKGVNMNMGEDSWSLLKQKYAGDSGWIRVNIIAGSKVPQVRAFKNPEEFATQSEKKSARFLEVSGSKAFLELKKKAESGRLVILLQKHAVAAIEAKPVSSEKKLLSLAKALPLDKIAATISE